MILEFRHWVAIASIAIYIAILISIPFRRKKIFQSSGKLVMKLTSSSAKIFGIYILCALIICVLPLRNFSPYLYVILSFAAILGCEIGAREARSFRIAGFYENLIVWGIYVISYDDIYALPTLAYENDKDTVGVDFKYLQIILNSGKEIQMFFKDKEEREQAKSIIISKRIDIVGNSIVRG